LIIAPSVLPQEVTPFAVILVEELDCSLSLASMLPLALSEVLEVSLSEVIEHYFDGSEESVWVRRVEEALEHQRSQQEGEEWLVREASRLSLELERNHEGGGDTF
jgi:hypothetical protein